jgi:UDP-glucose 4-epimerase
MCKKYICITGGTGFIGSHCCVSLIHEGYDVILLDNLNNSNIDVIERIYHITGIRPLFHKIDLRNASELNDFFNEYCNKIYCVIHCASLKSISESYLNPIDYYDTNVLGTINLIKSMIIGNCKNIIFSSSATVYGNNPDYIPLSENCDRHVMHPYGQTKIIIEDLLKNIIESDFTWNVIILRYFNPVGAHPSGRLEENPKIKPSNLFPIICDVALGKINKLIIYGKDYNTPDGTAIRDYIHIMDLAEGHIAALRKINELHYDVINIGTGRGHSVLEVINCMEEVSGLVIKYEFSERREGDVPICYTSTEKAYKLLEWTAQRTLEDMCRDAWNSKIQK